MKLYTNGMIEIDDEWIGLYVYQDQAGTRVLDKSANVVKMPQDRYALSHDHPASGVAGRAQFEQDIRNLFA